MASQIKTRQPPYGFRHTKIHQTTASERETEKEHVLPGRGGVDAALGWSVDERSAPSRLERAQALVRAIVLATAAGQAADRRFDARVTGGAH